MYCSGCGQPIAPYQQVCAYCGKPAVQAPPMTFLPYTRVQRHIHTLAVLWLVFSLFAILAWFMAIPFLGFIFNHGGHGFYRGDFPFGMSMGWFLPIITTIVLRSLRAWPARRHRSAPPRALGTHPGVGGRHPDADQISIRDRARNLHPLGAGAYTVRTGI